MRIVFMGTPDFAVPSLRALAAAGHDIAAVYTQPPRPAQRGKRPMPSPVHIAAGELELEVRTPASFKDDDDRRALTALNVDVIIVVAFGHILPEAVLSAARLGSINVHASLLPRWRGAAPVQRAILAGDAETGVTIMQMERGLDTGPMLRTERTPIDRKTAGELTEELAEMGARLIVEVLNVMPVAIPQPADGVTYAHKIDKAEAALDFTLSADVLECRVRAFNPAPGAWCAVAGERIRILAADVAPGSGSPGTILDDCFTIACGAGALRPTLVQRPGRRAMQAKEMLRGLPLAPGSVIG